jgi:hypothetical protein
MTLWQYSLNIQCLYYQNPLLDNVVESGELVHILKIIERLAFLYRTLEPSSLNLDLETGCPE